MRSIQAIDKDQSIPVNRIINALVGSRLNETLSLANANQLCNFPAIQVLQYGSYSFSEDTHAAKLLIPNLLK